jgi:hypothetical protein
MTPSACKCIALTPYMHYVRHYGSQLGHKAFVWGCRRSR